MGGVQWKCLIKLRRIQRASKKQAPRNPKLTKIREDADACDFKKPDYYEKSEQKRKRWKNSKQIIDGLKDSKNLNSIDYTSIEAPPSTKPQNKYCDITGLPAKYIDPQSNLRYHSSSVFQYIKSIPTPTVQSYLGLRNAGVILK